MRFLALLSGEHETLPREEFLTVLEADGADHTVEETFEDAVLVEAEQADFSRLAMTHEVCEVLCVCGRDDLGPVEELDLSFNGSFAVRASGLDAEPDEELEGELGALIEEVTDNQVDLEQPDVLFRALTAEDRLFVTRQVADIDTGSFEERRSHLRPYSSPVSLHPKLARAMVNLAGLSRGESVLDPLCGTGGLLLEAGLIGLEPHGRDVDPEMVEGAKENLAAYGVEAALGQGDVHELAASVDRTFDAVVADLPYGRASRKEGEQIAEVFVEQARRVTDGSVVFMSDRDDVAGLEPRFEIYVHKSLSRHLYVVEPDGDKG
ncbi:MAG: methyltransferase domain-containing protein [Candidatus Nanohaloarchaea archaeon]|nr:methyltransferase domain-containing protein [Candidatus Nanohaloarchaea archaeon]